MKEWTLAQLTEWLNGRTDILLCVTGPTGSGKSTLIGNLAARFAYKAAFPGKAVRNNPALLAKVVKSSNPTAAPELEKFVRSFVRKKVEKAGAGRSIAIDGMPRTVEQVSFLVDLALDYKKKLVFAYLNVNRSERERRLGKRDAVGDSALLKKRLDNDELVLPSVQARMVQVVLGGRFGYFFLVDTGGVRVKDQEKIKTPEGELDTTCGDVNRDEETLS